MRALLIILTALVLASCAQTPPKTTIAYSGDFKLDVPSTLLENSTIIAYEMVTFKTKDGSFISGRFITNDTEQLPENFDIKNYPEYILRIKTPEKEYSNYFKQASNEINILYNISSVKVSSFPKSGTTIYSLCKAHDCTAYIVKNSVSEQILEISSKGLAREKLIGLITGGLHVDDERKR